LFEEALAQGAYHAAGDEYDQHLQEEGNGKFGDRHAGSPSGGVGIFWKKGRSLNPGGD
jgi:hypothetical protein